MQKLKKIALEGFNSHALCIASFLSIGFSSLNRLPLMYANPCNYYSKRIFNIHAMCITSLIGVQVWVLRTDIKGWCHSSRIQRSKNLYIRSRVCKI